MLNVLRLLQALQSLQPSCYDSWHTGWILPTKLLWDQLMPFVVDSLHVEYCLLHAELALELQALWLSALQSRAEACCHVL